MIRPHHVPVVRVVILLYEGEVFWANISLNVHHVSIHPWLVLISESISKVFTKVLILAPYTIMHNEGNKFNK